MLLAAPCALYSCALSIASSMFIYFSSMYFVSILLSIVAGILYYLIVPYGKRKTAFYVALFIILTAYVTYIAFTVQRSDNAIISSQFHGLFAGIVIITGITDALLIPYMARHKNVIF